MYTYSCIGQQIAKHTCTQDTAAINSPCIHDQNNGTAEDTSQTPVFPLLQVQTANHANDLVLQAMLNRANRTSIFHLDSWDSIPLRTRWSCWHWERTIDSVNMRCLHIWARDRRLIRSELCLPLWG